MSDDDHTAMHDFRSQLSTTSTNVISTNNYISTASQRQLPISLSKNLPHILLNTISNDTILLRSATRRVIINKSKTTPTIQLFHQRPLIIQILVVIYTSVGSTNRTALKFSKHLSVPAIILEIK